MTPTDLDGPTVVLVSFKVVIETNEGRNRAAFVVAQIVVSTELMAAFDDQRLIVKRWLSKVSDGKLAELNSSAAELAGQGNPVIRASRTEPRIPRRKRFSVDRQSFPATISPCSRAGRRVS